MKFFSEVGICLLAVFGLFVILTLLIKKDTRSTLPSKFWFHYLLVLMLSVCSFGIVYWTSCNYFIVPPSEAIITSARADAYAQGLKKGLSQNRNLLLRTSFKRFVLNKDTIYLSGKRRSSDVDEDDAY
jgi:hypothetical protein